MAPKAAPKMKLNPVIAAAQERVRLMKEAEERQKEQERLEKLEEERLAREEAERKKREDDEREALLASRAAARAEAKRKGEYMSKAEKVRRREMDERRRVMIEKGLIKIPAVDEGVEAPKVGKISKKDRTVKKHKKRLPKTLEEEIAEAAAAKAAEEERLRLERLAETEDERATEDLDWEEQAAREERRAARAEKKRLAAEEAAKNPVKNEDSDDDWPSSDDDSSDYESSSEEKAAAPVVDAKPKVSGAAIAKAAIQAKKDTKAEIRPPKYRSPVCCIMGHVDTGKTKLLDKIRRTNVQEGEAGGITQQIGATFFPDYALLEQIRKVDKNMSLKTPGLLIIDTPGHESFNNLRSRGSSLCDVAILVVDIMHGLEPQTIESLNMLRNKKVPFVIALNKIDRLYGWKSAEYRPVRQSFAVQTETQQEFEDRTAKIQLHLAQLGLNTALYWENDSHEDTISIIPTSAITGEGIPDILHQLMEMTQGSLGNKNDLAWESELSCTVLEVKNIEGLGTTIDVMLVQGSLREGDTIVVCGMSGPIVTQVRALLTPHPMKEIRVKAEYLHHKVIHASMGVKIAAPGLEEAVAGTQLYVVGPDDDVEDLKEEVMEDMGEIFKSVNKSGEGVYVMASTLGSLEALLCFLKDEKVPVCQVSLGTVNLKDIKKAAIMREKGREDMAVILAFDVKVDPDAAKEAEHLGVQIFSAEIIYHLTIKFSQYLKEVEEKRKSEIDSKVVFPAHLKILPQFIFNKHDPIIVGVLVEGGLLRVGTPLVTSDKDHIKVGRVTSIEYNHKAVTEAKKGMEVCIKISPYPGSDNVYFGRQFDETSKLVSRLTREGIDALKELYRDVLTMDDWKLVKQLKELFKL
eukprot:GDKK01024999.1.p1 GENE.GDKK01024999.1~~GDKK01024999.1.p1  ORF type:complete len:871 (+),score=311.76 GDKK01024999.1:31-2613(+)